jgi:hypothetical protein
MPRSHPRSSPRAASWQALFDRFALFQAMPALISPGPDAKRPDKSALSRKLNRWHDRERAYLPQKPVNLTQQHIDALLSQLGKQSPGGAFWSGAWRAIILDRDDYRCQRCGRSGETGVQVPLEGRLALRLELDHKKPRAHDGADFELDNIQTLCRTCNIVKGRLKEAYFEAELQSFAAALAGIRSSRRKHGHRLTRR